MEEGAPRQVNGAWRGRAAGAGRGGRGVSFTPRAPRAPAASPRPDPQPLPGPFSAPAPGVATPHRADLSTGVSRSCRLKTSPNHPQVTQSLWSGQRMSTSESAVRATRMGPKVS